jgi:hypothetical protein
MNLLLEGRRERWFGRSALTLAAFLGTTLFAGAALAEDGSRDEPKEADRTPAPLQPGWSLSAFGGYGSDIDIAGDAQVFEVFGAGLGARLRYAADFGLVVGARLSHHFGETQDSATLSSALFEIGWALPCGPLRAEPFASAGMSRTFDEDSLCNVMTGNCSTVGGADVGATLGVGLSLVYPLADRFFVGATAETLLVVGPSLGVLGYATAGTTL